MYWQRANVSMLQMGCYCESYVKSVARLAAFTPVFYPDYRPLGRGGGGWGGKGRILTWPEGKFNAQFFVGADILWDFVFFLGGSSLTCLDKMLMCLRRFEKFPLSAF